MSEHEPLRCPHCSGKLTSFVRRDDELARIREATIRDARVIARESQLAALKVEKRLIAELVSRVRAERDANAAECRRLVVEYADRAPLEAENGHLRAIVALYLSLHGNHAVPDELRALASSCATRAGAVAK